MKILDIDSYPNLLDHLKLSSIDVCKIIENYDLSFPQTRNYEVENKIKFPMFLTPFYKYVYYNNDILNQSDFHNYYLSENKTYFDENTFKPEILEGLRARIFRTYPSLVRDLHFGLFVKENIEEGQIIYNRNLDTKEGIDLLIKLKDTLYAINLFTDTKNSRLSREKKVLRHTPFDNVKYVELPVKFEGSLKCGKFFLYGENEMNVLKKILIN